MEAKDSMKKIVVILSICVLSTLSFFSGCVNIPEELTQFSIMAFDVEPSIINAGDYANLSWVVISASSVTIDNGIGNVALTGHRMIQPTQTTTYTLIASNATTTRNATATVSVKPIQQTITDSTNDVATIDYSTGEINVIKSHPEVNVKNLDIAKITFKKEGTEVTLIMQVEGNIENRGSIIDLYSGDIHDSLDFVEYDFQLITSGDNYRISYSNRTGQLKNGLETINLTSSDFSVVGDTLTLWFSLRSVDEVYEELSVTSMFMKGSFNEGELNPPGLVYLSDICPNPPLKINNAYAPSIGYVRVPVQFTGSIASLTGQPPYEYHWDFGDNSTSMHLKPAHIYYKPGVYTYIFTVTDQVGDTDNKTGTITIEP